VNRGVAAHRLAKKSRYGDYLDWLAAKDLEAAVKLDPKDFTAWHNYGDLNYASGDDWVHNSHANAQRALWAFNHAIALNPKSARTYLGRGWTYYELNDQAHADADFQKALQLDPSLRADMQKEIANIQERHRRVGTAIVPTVVQPAQESARNNASNAKGVYPEQTLAHMNLSPNLTAEQLWNMGQSLDQRKQTGQAAAVFLKCSEMGHIRCTSALGQMYDQGDGVPLDRIRAVWYLTRAANGGNRGAEYEIGVYWEEGEVLPLDQKKAMEWYMKSAQQGFPQGERRIGLAYEFGESLPRSRPMAIEWLSKAAAQGDGIVLGSNSNPTQPEYPRAISRHGRVQRLLSKSLSDTVCGAPDTPDRRRLQCERLQPQRGG
jgi:TPR repeat protein